MMAVMRERVLAWAGGAIAVAAAGGLAAYFAVAGLGRATDVASVVAMFIGLAGLAVSIYGLYQARREPARSSAGAGQTVTGSAVAGNVTQISGVTGNLHIGGAPAATDGDADSSS
jgi:hypothetical protein